MVLCLEPVVLYCLEWLAAPRNSYNATFFRNKESKNTPVVLVSGTGSLRDLNSVGERPFAMTDRITLALTDTYNETGTKYEPLEPPIEQA